MGSCDLAMIGLGVVGRNLVVNTDDHGLKVAVYDRTSSTVDEFVDRNARGTEVIGTHTLEDLVRQLSKARRVKLMIKAGQPVDGTIDRLIPVLEEGNISIDGGNSNNEDTIRRAGYVESKNMLWIGTGVSGGEEGVRFRP